MVNDTPTPTPFDEFTLEDVLDEAVGDNFEIATWTTGEASIRFPRDKMDAVLDALISLSDSYHGIDGFDTAEHRRDWRIINQNATLILVMSGWTIPAGT